eukprot:365255-Chlamydomonas_euryale.AAC.29
MLPHHQLPEARRLNPSPSMYWTWEPTGWCSGETVIGLYVDRGWKHAVAHGEPAGQCYAQDTRPPGMGIHLAIHRRGFLVLSNTTLALQKSLASCSCTNCLPMHLSTSSFCEAHTGEREMC